MITVQGLADDDKTVRTQITLTEGIKRIVEEAAEKQGESLSEYLRKASMIRFVLDKNRKTDLNKLASSVVGSINLKNHPAWSTKEKIYKWSRKIREEF